MKLLLGPLLLRDVLQRLQGPHEPALGVVDGGSREAQPASPFAQFGEKVRRLVGLLDERRLAALAGIPVLDGLEILIDKQVGQAGSRPAAVEGPPVIGRPENLMGTDPAQLLQRPVPVKDPVVPPDDERGNRRALDDALESPLAVLEAFLGQLPLGDVLQGLLGAHHFTPRAPDQSSREPQPASPFAQFGKEVCRLVGLLDERRLAALAGIPALDGVEILIDKQVGQTGPRPAAVEGPPVIGRPEHLMGTDPAQLLERPVPVKDPVVPPDDERGDRRALHHALEPALAVRKILFRAPGTFLGLREFDGLLRCFSALSMSGPRFVRFMATGLREEHGIE